MTSSRVLLPLAVGGMLFHVLGYFGRISGAPSVSPRETCIWEPYWGGI